MKFYTDFPSANRAIGQKLKKAKKSDCLKRYQRRTILPATTHEKNIEITQEVHATQEPVVGVPKGTRAIRHRKQGKFPESKTWKKPAKK